MRFRIRQHRTRALSAEKNQADRFRHRSTAHGHAAPGKHYSFYFLGSWHFIVSSGLTRPPGAKRTTTCDTAFGEHNRAQICREPQCNDVDGASKLRATRVCMNIALVVGGVQSGCIVQLEWGSHSLIGSRSVRDWKVFVLFFTVDQMSQLASNSPRGDRRRLLRVE